VKTKFLGLVGCMALLGVSQASASSITYDVTPLTIGPYSLIGGTITTDGNTGSLASSDITAWSLTFQNDSETPVLVTGTTLYGSFSNSALSATTTALYWDFTASIGQLFAIGDFSTWLYVLTDAVSGCDIGDSYACLGDLEPNEVGVQGMAES
jgi:hypothetical protein